MKTVLLIALAVGSVGCNKKPVDAPAPPGKKDAAAAVPAGPISEENLGIKIFPGAKIVSSGESPQIVSANLRAREPGAAIVKFYELELGLPESGRAAGAVSGTKGDISYGISVIPGNSVTEISILGTK